MASRLRAEGYPAQLLTHQGEHEVLIRQLASEADAKALQTKLSVLMGGGGGRVQMLTSPV
jgi:hypothetical protein